MEMEYFPKLRKSQTSNTNRNHLNRKITKNLKNSAIYFRKNKKNESNKINRSHVIYDDLEKKISIDLKNDVEFLNLNKIEENLEKFKDHFSHLEKEEMMNSTIKDFINSELNFKLQYDGLKIEESLLDNKIEIQNVSDSVNIKKFSSISNEKISSNYESSEKYSDKNIFEDQEYNINHSDYQIESNTREKNKFKSKSARDRISINKSKIFQIDNQNYSEISENKNVIDSEFKIDIQNYNIEIHTKKKISIQKKFTTKVLQKKNEINSNINKSHKSKQSSEYQVPSESPYTSNENTKSKINQQSCHNCIICEESSHVEFIINISKTCEHKICLLCGKIFYEDKIESGEFPLTCPMFKCGANFSNEEIISKLVSTIHYDNYKIREKNYLNSYGESSVTLNRDEKKILTLLSSNKNSEILNENFKNVLDTLKSFSKPHVINVTNMDSIFTYAKIKEIFCKNCNEPALLGKLTTNKIKCMNCFKQFCKFCLSEITADHFNLSKQVYCKILRRKINGKRPTVKLNKFKPGFMRRFCEVLLMNIFSFCICMSYFNHLVKINLLKFTHLITCRKFSEKTFFELRMKNMINKNTRAKTRKIFIYLKSIGNFMVLITSIITRLLIFIITLPICLMIIPFFHLINEIIK